MKNGNRTPKIHVLNGEYLMFEDDNIELALFLRQVVPQLQSAMEPYYRRLQAAEKFNIIEVFGMLELWREHIAFLWAGHSPRQQPAFENRIREEWNEVRAIQKQIYEKVEREYERRKAAS
jgi:hypothetical protein